MPKHGPLLGCVILGVLYGVGLDILTILVTLTGFGLFRSIFVLFTVASIFCNLVGGLGDEMLPIIDRRSSPIPNIFTVYLMHGVY